MYQPELNQLIDATIADGQLSDKERRVLLRRAQALGIDAEEFDVYLDGRLYQRRYELGLEERAHLSGTRARPVTAPAPPGAVVASAVPLSKCPACKEPLGGLSHVCPACGQLIDAAHDAHGRLEEMLGEMEDLLIEAKAQAAPPVGRLSRSGALYLVPTLLALIMSVFGFALAGNEMGWGWWIIAALVFGLGWLIDRAVQHRRQNQANLPSPARQHRPFAEIKAGFDKHARQISLFFGADRQVAQVVDTLRREMAAVQPAAASPAGALTPRRVLGGLCLLALGLGPLLSQGRLFPADTKEQVARGEALVQFGRLPEARLLLDSLELEPNRVRLACLIQRAELDQRLDSVPELLAARHYPEARQLLLRLHWRRVNPDPMYLYAERPAFRAFRARKADLNDRLPAHYQLLVDTALSQ